MNLYFSQPTAQWNKRETANGYYGYDQAVAETPSGNFVYAWRKYRCLASPCLTSSAYVYEIEYMVADPVGRVVRPVVKLADLSGSSISTYDYSPTLAAA